MREDSTLLVCLEDCLNGVDNERTRDRFWHVSQQANWDNVQTIGSEGINAPIGLDNKARKKSIVKSHSPWIFRWYR